MIPNFKDFADDEGFIWLPWEELQEYERMKNFWMAQFLDQAALAPHAPFIGT